MKSSPLEDALALQMTAYGLAFERDYRFAPPRLWRFDFCLPDIGLAIEVEGGTWVGGRHNSPKGFRADCEKYNAATLRGWRLLRFVGADIKEGKAIDTIREAVEKESHGVVVPLFLNVNGQRKNVGELEGRTFRKRVSGSRHFLRKPPAIAIDSEVWSHIYPGIDTIEVKDLETATTYEVNASVFEARRILINRGHGVQYALPFDLWSKT